MSDRTTVWTRRRDRDEEGSVLVQVAISLLVLTGFLTFVLDYGVLWMSRAQAQNAADAAALSGAVARAYDDLADPPAAGGIAETSTISAGNANPVWSVTPVVRASFVCPPGVAGRCVRADVYRNGEFGSTPLPILFGKVLNIASQGVRATATAVVATANATECLRPFAVADRWIENTGNTEFNRWQKTGSTYVELTPHDTYVSPLDGGTPTGYQLPADFGAPATLKLGNPNSGTDPLVSGWFAPIRLPDGAGGYTSGASDYRAAIGSCTGVPIPVGTWVPVETGVMAGPTAQGYRDLHDKDPAAVWNSGTKSIDHSCAPGACGSISPRIVPIAVFNLDDFQRRSVSGDWSSCPGGGKCVQIVRILGFFVADMVGSAIVGYLMTYPGTLVPGAPGPGTGSFLKTVQLVQ